MMRRVVNFWGVYSAFGVIELKNVLQYNAWFWVEMLRNIIAMLIMTAFWQAIYAGKTDLGGLALTTTLNYVILARALGTANSASVYWWMAEGIGKGELELQLLRPVDFQLMHLFRDATGWVINLLRALPGLLIALLAFGARLPTEPLVYLAFMATFILGGVVMYFFEFILGCLGFYTTEMWGLAVLRNGIALFFSGALIPLDLLPTTVQAIAGATPFAQALYLPIAFLSGVRPVGELGNAILLQATSIVVLFLLSRWIFARAQRVLTVQGG
jgi:ABC-2 type transport system permease protein